MAKVYDLLIKAKSDTRDAERAMKQLQRNVEQMGRRVANAGRTLTMAVTAPIVAMGVLGVRELNDMQKATAQTNAVLKSTGGIAGVTQKHVEKLSTSLSRMSGIDDQLIQGGQNILLTFTKIGAKDGVFDRATKAALDLSVAFGKDMNSSAVLVGKALQDPIKGVSALSRVGVSFSADQKKVIERLVETGRSADAQKLILKELETQVKGSAAAYGTTAAGAVGRLKEQFSGIAAQMVTNLLPAFNQLSGYLQRGMNFFEGLSASTKKWVGVGMLMAAALGPILWGLGSLIAASQALIPLLLGITAPVAAVAVGIAALAAVLVYAYTTSSTFRDTVNSAFTQVVEHVTIALESLRATITTWVGWGQAFWRTFGDQITTYTRAWWNAVRGIIGGQLQVIRGVIQTVLAVLRGDWSGAWDGIKTILSGAWTIIRTIVSAGAGAIRSILANGWEAMNNGARAAWNGFKNLAENAFEAIPGLARGALGGLAAIMRGVGQSAGAALAGALKDAVNAVLDKIRGISLPKVTLPGTDKSIGGGSPFSGLPALARGGITKGPSIAGEAGPEAVIPLGRSAQNRADAARVLGELGIRGGDTNVTVVAASADAEAVAQRVLFALGGSRLRMGGGV